MHSVDPDNFGRPERFAATALSTADTVHKAGLANVVTARHTVGWLRCVAHKAEGAALVCFRRRNSGGFSDPLQCFGQGAGQAVCEAFFVGLVIRPGLLASGGVGRERELPLVNRSECTVAAAG